MAIIIFWIMAMQRSASFSAECSLPQHIPTIVPAQIFINNDHRRTKFSSERKVLASQGEQRCGCLNTKQIKTEPCYHFKRLVSATVQHVEDEGEREVQHVEDEGEREVPACFAWTPFIPFRRRSAQASTA